MKRHRIQSAVARIPRKFQTVRQNPTISYVVSLNFPGVEAHVKEHSFPAHIVSCGVCLYWKNRASWSARASFLDEASGKKLTWLACSTVGGALCWPCSSSGVGRDRYARGVGGFKLSNLLRHQRSASHLSAVRLWNARAKAGVEEATRPAVAAAGSAASPEVAAAGSAASPEHPRLEASDFVFVRTLLQTRGSFSSWAAWVAASAGTSSARQPPLSECKRGFQTLASFERLVTQQVLKVGEAFWLQADGLGRAYQAAIGAVVWKFPTSLSWLLQPGLQPLG